MERDWNDALVLGIGGLIKVHDIGKVEFSRKLEMPFRMTKRGLILINVFSLTLYCIVTLLLFPYFALSP